MLFKHDLTGTTNVVVFFIATPRSLSDSDQLYLQEKVLSRAYIIVFEWLTYVGLLVCRQWSYNNCIN